MESPIGSSFIPHDTAKAAERSYRPDAGGLGELFMLLSIVLLVASMALGVGVFLYKEYLTTASTSKLQQLQRAKSAFEPSLIQQLTRLDDRMHAGDMILGQHLAPTAFFHSLEQATLSTVSFKSLQFSAADPQHITIQMQGLAQSVNSIALQAEVFSKNGVITSPIFSGIARDIDGVRFNFTALINPAAINYGHKVDSNQAQQQNPLQPQVQQSPQGAIPSQVPSVSNSEQE